MPDRSAPGRGKSRGFTLMEMLTVVIIVGILAAIAVPQYQRTLETSKADDASATAKMIGTTNRMYFLDRRSYADSGSALSTGNNSSACSAAPSHPASDLLGCGYLAKQDWDSKPYQFYAGPTTCGAGNVSCARRRTGSSPGTDGTPYKNWGYNVDSNGGVSAIGAAPTPSQ
ncbi:MAG TPA: prepilin-type N-terminal cleavage/methylation domain-containing protein [Elusimicrobiota bacterium]|jgi:type IV pilus assembly protein PilE|nr:prepilin-type N-terminal cleavage/methylation domain-containing protein [Elusimicrobiota bacterium]